MDDEPILRNLVIPKVDERVISLFKAACAEVDITLQQGWIAAFRPFVDSVIRDIECNPESDDLSVHQLRKMIDELCPMPKLNARGGLAE